VVLYPGQASLSRRVARSRGTNQEGKHRYLPTTYSYVLCSQSIRIPPCLHHQQISSSPFGLNVGGLCPAFVQSPSVFFSVWLNQSRLDSFSLGAPRPFILDGPSYGRIIVLRVCHNSGFLATSYTVHRYQVISFHSFPVRFGQPIHHLEPGVKS
jgi:hypothetical protein